MKSVCNKRCTNPEPQRKGQEHLSEKRRYIGSLDGSIVEAVQEPDQPQVWGSLWREVSAAILDSTLSIPYSPGESR